MEKLPHYYQVVAHGKSTGTIDNESNGLTTLKVDAPKQFDGPGDQWSPEELLIAAIADCLILTFRAVASASKFDWLELSCEVKGTLERVDNKTQFTEIYQTASLKVNEQTSDEKAHQLLDKAEKNCLITNSLTAKTHLKIDVKKV